MLLSIKEDIDLAKAKAKQNIDQKIENMKATLLAKTHFVSEVHRLKREELNRYLADKDQFSKDPNSFPFIQLEMNISKCSLEDSVKKIKDAIDISEEFYLKFEKLRRQANLKLQAAKTILEIRSAVEFLDDNLID